MRKIPLTTMRSLTVAVSFLTILAGCASTSPSRPQEFGLQAVKADALLNRITWGANSSSFHEIKAIGADHFLAQQLHPGDDRLPLSIETQINNLTISQRPFDQLVIALEQRRKQINTIADDDEKKGAQRAYQEELNRLAREAATRSLLRDTYSHNQLREQMTWFWLNHFNVHQGKHNLRAMVGDYEENAIRPHALGKFRDLLTATVHHPAMLRYLDNEQNAANHINENYARELMELHTLGVDSGYTQKDVQELARILTGAGVNLGTETPRIRPKLQNQYVRRGLFEFNPQRHDYGDKVLLGKVVRGRGLMEIDEAIDLLSRQPATARFISRKLAAFFVGDDPSAALVQRMSNVFLHTDGDIAATLAELFSSPEFKQSLNHEFKDPVHYVVSAVRLAYDGKPILNAGPMIGWLQRMGEPLYGRQTPDGFPLASSAWISPGQMTTRFEIGKAIGSGSAGLFKADEPQVHDRPAFPQLANPFFYESLQKTLGATTRQALDQAASPQEWNAFLLSSPEFMVR
ncbi:MAG TPA: DUF1800 domain-containing protein [Noviherbaspirillum sp.]|uniref:DUF1800 domain-containing protein n=1 Tax=Noviherbaspirillum sp. TaxID=1926288 RepID=UPI002B49425A|nr:DUF1800 domain-containing protein [Noviherbaspirillum sp.]HJV84066.1 DUF1800 domain-containing protein [Noviherbaspirillum sp.]